MTSAVLDVPWRRPGRLAYARRRVRNAVRPPVTVLPAPPGLVRERDVAVRMRDGVVLRVNVYRPAGRGPFPVLLSVHPYGKDALPVRRRRGWALNFQFRIMNQSEPLAVSELTGWEAPDPAWWVAQGYAVVNADERGAGTSEGTGSLLSDAEARDSHDLVQWAGVQPWSNGNVGMLGVSYLALSQYKAAATHPPCLKAICPWEGFTDAYRDFMTPGGIVENGFSRIWQAVTRRTARLGDDLGLERRRHPLRDAWWESLSPPLERITVPMLVCASFSDANLHSVGSFRALQRAGSAERFGYLHRGPKWATFYGQEAKAAQLTFFDRYLRGRDVPPPPRVRLEVREDHDLVVEVRAEDEWPLARTRWTSLHLADGGRLVETPDDAGSASFDLRRNAAAFSYAFARDTELTGPMTLTLWASLSGADDASIFAAVEKIHNGKVVPFEGSYGYGRDRVARGWLRMSMRRPDDVVSAPHQPEHGLRDRRPVAPGEVVRLDIPLTPSATLFRAGDALRLLVAGRYPEPRNPLFGHFPAHYVRSPRGRCTLHWEAARAARLEVPVIPSREDPVAPRLRDRSVGDGAAPAPTP